jgi:iron-sulfur cluster assembly accessory protein
VVLTAAAVRKVRQLVAQEGRADLRLRVAVQPGGCSGLRYQLFFDDRLLDNDKIITFADDDSAGADHDAGYDSGYESGDDEPQQSPQGDPAGVDTGSVEGVIDRMSLPYLAGASIHYVDTIEQQGFTIDNPNAAGSCACGDSFH